MTNALPLQVAIVGFRHAHIYDLLHHVRQHASLRLVAVCEENETARAAVEALELGVPIFSSYEKMLQEVPAEVICVGDVFGLRGQRVQRALLDGRHVISDKPFCTSLSEWHSIQKLLQEKGLQLGCMLDLRDHPNYIALRQLIRQGAIGEVCAVSFGGQHPLNLGQRPAWYFEAGMHGGTLNDVGIHAFDFLPWLTGQELSRVDYGRTWNPVAPQFPHFGSAAQVTLTLANGAGVQGDVSYLVPDSAGFSLPQYWRTTVWGSLGVAETHVTADGARFFRAGQKEWETLTCPGTPGRYLQAFLEEIEGRPAADGPTTVSNLRAQLVALQIQAAANNQESGLLG